MNNNINHAYSHHWISNKSASHRIAFQKRAVETFDKLYKNIILQNFQGEILDLGCGDGSLVKALNNTDGIKATGTDLSYGINFEKDSLPYEKNKFDIIIMYSVLEHLNDPANIILETKRVLKKDGSIILVIPNYKTTKESFYDDPTHVRPYTPEGVIYLMNIFQLNKLFMGLWTVGKSNTFWKMPYKWQFFIGKYLPFRGNNKYAPKFLKGKSTTMICVFNKLVNKNV